MQVLYATSNHTKFTIADHVCAQFNLSLLQTTIEIDEIQGEDGILIAQDKAKKAFESLQKPVIISDDNWFIPGLNGFPGPYMKSMNHWFDVEDWLRLTTTLQDRTIILRQIAVYQDSNTQKVFMSDLQGTLLHEIRGTAKPNQTHDAITSFDGGKQSIAEAHERGEPASFTHRTAWHDFAEWYSTQHEQATKA